MNDGAVLSTFGKTIHPGCELALWHNPDEQFRPDMGRGDRFRLVIVRAGTGILRIGSTRECFIAQSCFCLNDQDDLELEQALGLKAEAAYFHPRIINSDFNYENIRHGAGNFTMTQWNDWNTLRAFVPEYPFPAHVADMRARHTRQMPVSLPLMQRLEGLMAKMARELDEQPDSNWICRSRSYFIEMLFAVDYVFRHPEEDIIPLAQLELAEPSDEVGAVLLFLHVHYGEKITLERLAEHFHTNRTTLSESFRKVTGLSIIDYLIRLRLQYAATLLRDTILPVSEVASRVGYPDVTSFGRAFRKQLSSTPSAYRERHCWLLKYI